MTGMTRDINFEPQHKSGFIEFLQRCLKGQSLSRSIVEFVRDRVALLLGQILHAGALRQVLADQAIRVLVGAALPRMVWSGEIEDR